MRERVDPNKPNLYVVENRYINTKDQKANTFTKAFGAEGFDSVMKHVVSDPPQNMLKDNSR